MTQKKKICMIVEHDFSPPHVRTNDEFRFLSEAGYNVTLIAIAKRKLPEFENTEFGPLKRVFRLGKTKPRLPYFHNPLLMVKTFLMAKAEKAILYYVYDMGNISNAVLLKMLGHKVIYDIGDDSPSNQAGFVIRKLKTERFGNFLEKVLRSLEGQSMKHFDVTVNLTKALADDRERFTDKLETIYYTPPPEFNPDNVDPGLIKKYQNTDLVGYEGYFIFEKGTDIIPKLADKLGTRKKRTKVMIIGKADVSTPNIYVTGYMHYLQIPKYLNLCKLGLALLKPWSYSYKISMPNKVIDYLCCGTPVIASKGFDEIGKIIQRSKGGILVDHTDFDDVYSAIESLLDNEPERKEMARRAREYAKKHHNWENFRKKFVGIVESVLEEGK